MSHPLLGQRVGVQVPASSANLGVGFDCLALALELHLTATVEVIDGPESTLAVEGEGKARLALDESNRFLAGFRVAWRRFEPRMGAAVPPISIVMNNEIPLGRGLGSSAAATVAGLLAAHELAEGGAVPGELLIKIASDIEGHPDNAAAALLGGFVLFADGRATRFKPPAELRCVLFVPERELATADMRAVLHKSVPLSDAVVNAAGVGALVAAFATGDLSLLSAMSDDRLHEPYRAAVYPELVPMKASAAAAGALGCALSGAGSSILALTDDADADSVAIAFDETAEKLQLAGTVRIINPAATGASVS